MMYNFLALKLSDVAFIMLINVKMPAILTFMSSRAYHGSEFVVANTLAKFMEKVGAV